MKTQGMSLFTPESTRAALDDACRVAGLDARDARLVRMGENAMYHLIGDGVMARIGRSPEAADKEVRVARWLAWHEVPAVRLIEEITQPVRVDDVSVTFWEFIEDSEQPTTSRDLARMLREVHSLPAPTTFTLPAFAPMPKVRNRLSVLSYGYLSEDDIDFLSSLYRTLEAEYATVSFSLPPGPIHADAHNGNLMRDRDGTVRLIDFEDFAWGPREWDVAVEAIRYQAFGWITRAEYDDYTRTYGFDALEWDGFAVLRGIRELNMTTWLAQRLGESVEIDREVNRRIRDLRDPDSPRHWRAL